MPRSTPRGRHAAPGRAWQPRALPRPATRSAGRHRAPSPGVGQPASVVLMGVTATSLGLATLVPAAGQAEHAAPAIRTTPVAASAPDVVAPPADTALAERRTAAARASRARSAARAAAATPPPPVDPLPSCRVDAAATRAYGNGRIPLSALCTLPAHDGHALRADAARAFAALDAAYTAHFGTPVCVTDSYRSLAAQQSLARRKPGLAARPGTSEHGNGVAVDLACGVEGYRTPQHRWLVANADRFGWHQPAWARDGGRREEPWHWEFRD